MEMGLDFPDLPLGMVTDLHLKRCKHLLNSRLHFWILGHSF